MYIQLYLKLFDLLTTRVALFWTKRVHRGCSGQVRETRDGGRVWRGDTARHKPEVGRVRCRASDAGLSPLTPQGRNKWRPGTHNIMTQDFLWHPSVILMHTFEDSRGMIECLNPA